MITGKNLILNLLVGFGDFYPRTYMGRLTVTFAIIFGLTLVSLTVVSLDIIKKYEPNEYNVEIKELNYVIEFYDSFENKLEKIDRNKSNRGDQIFFQIE